MSLTWKDIGQWKTDHINTAASDIRGVAKALGKVSEDSRIGLGNVYEADFTGSAAESAYSSTRALSLDMENTIEFISILAKCVDEAATGVDNVKSLILEVHELAASYRLYVTDDGNVCLSSVLSTQLAEDFFSSCMSALDKLNFVFPSDQGNYAETLLALSVAKGSTEISSVRASVEGHNVGFGSGVDGVGRSNYTETSVTPLTQTIEGPVVPADVVTNTETIESAILDVVSKGKDVVDKFVASLNLIARGERPKVSDLPSTDIYGYFTNVFESTIESSVKNYGEVPSGRTTWTASVVLWANKNTWVRPVLKCGGIALDGIEGVVAASEQYEDDTDTYPNMAESEKIRRMVIKGLGVGVGSALGSSVGAAVMTFVVTGFNIEEGPLATLAGAIGGGTGSIVGGVWGSEAGSSFADWLNDLWRG